jgi:membrane protease YdiL (CAAX protease family)
MGGCTGALGAAFILTILVCAVLPIDAGKVFTGFFVALAAVVGFEAIYRRSKG